MSNNKYIWSLTDEVRKIMFQDILEHDVDLNITGIAVSNNLISTASIEPKRIYPISKVKDNVFTFIINNKQLNESININTLILMGEARSSSGTKAIQYARLDYRDARLTLEPESSGDQSLEINVEIDFKDANVYLNINVEGSGILDGVNEKIDALKDSLKEELKGDIPNIANVDELVTNESLNARGFLTDVAAEAKYLKIADKPTVDLSNHVTKAELEAKNYASKAYVDEHYARLGDIERFIDQRELNDALSGKNYLDTSTADNKYLLKSEAANLGSGSGGVTITPVEDATDDTKGKVSLTQIKDLANTKVEEVLATKGYATTANLNTLLEGKVTVVSAELRENTLVLTKSDRSEITVELSKFVDTLNVPGDLFKEARLNAGKLVLTQHDGDTTEVDLNAFIKEDTLNAKVTELLQTVDTKISQKVDGKFIDIIDKDSFVTDAKLNSKISELDLENTYVKKSENVTINDATADVAGKISENKVKELTEEVLSTKNYLTSHQDISGKLNESDLTTKVEDILDTKGYLTSHQSLDHLLPSNDLNDRVDTILQSKNYLTSNDISGKLNESDLNGKVEEILGTKNYLTEHQSLDAYYTIDAADGKFATKEDIQRATGGTAVVSAGDEVEGIVTLNKIKELASHTITEGNYVTTDQIPSLDGLLREDQLSDKVDEILEGKHYLTDHQDISDKLDKSEAESTYLKITDKPDISNLVTNETLTRELGNKLNESELSTKVDEILDTKGYLTQHQNLDHLLPKSELTAEVNKVLDTKNYLTSHQDISGKLNTSDLSGQVDNILNTKSYATISQLNDKINTVDVDNKVESILNTKGYLTSTDISGKLDTSTYNTEKAKFANVDTTNLALKSVELNSSNKLVFTNISGTSTEVDLSKFIDTPLFSSVRLDDDANELVFSGSSNQDVRINLSKYLNNIVVPTANQDTAGIMSFTTVEEKAVAKIEEILATKSYLSSHQSIDHLLPTSQLNDKVNELLNTKGYLTSNDISGKLDTSTYTSDKQTLEESISQKLSSTALDNYYTKEQADGKYVLNTTHVSDTTADNYGLVSHNYIKNMVDTAVSTAKSEIENNEGSFTIDDVIRRLTNRQ